MSDDDTDIDEAEDEGPGLTDAAWWVQTYDDKGNSKTPKLFAVLRKEVIEAWKAAIKDGTVTKPTMTDSLLDYIATKEFGTHVDKERNRRSHRLVQDAEYILDGLSEDGAYVDPLLSQVHRVGDGTDAPLRYWTVQMWEFWADNRFDKAKAAVAAADQAIKVRRRMVEAIRNKKVTFTGELWL